jgi:hypothetical protein
MEEVMTMISLTSPDLSLATVEGDLPVEIVQQHGVGLGHDLINLSRIQLDYCRRRPSC